MNYRAEIRKTGYKATDVRVWVLARLVSNHEPQTARQLYKQFKGNADLASVYRALKILEEIGFVYHEISASGKKYFFADEYHHHVICEKCGKSKCVPCRMKFDDVPGFSKVKHQLSLSGICDKCLNS